jgi:hypothetical protein
VPASQIRQPSPIEASARADIACRDLTALLPIGQKRYIGEARVRLLDGAVGKLGRIRASSDAKDNHWMSRPFGCLLRTADLGHTCANLCRYPNMKVIDNVFFLGVTCPQDAS